MATLYWATCIHCDWTGNAHEDHHEAAKEQMEHLSDNPDHSTTVTNNEDEAARAEYEKSVYGE